MLKTTQSLEVNNSSNQTSIKNKQLKKQLIEEAIQTAVKLENQIGNLFEVDFVKDMYFDEICDSERKGQSIIVALSNMYGYAYTDCIRKEANNE